MWFDLVFFKPSVGLIVTREFLKQKPFRLDPSASVTTNKPAVRQLKKQNSVGCSCSFLFDLFLFLTSLHKLFRTCRRIFLFFVFLVFSSCLSLDLKDKKQQGGPESLVVNGVIDTLQF